jgi:hypothetical protein
MTMPSASDFMKLFDALGEQAKAVAEADRLSRPPTMLIDQFNRLAVAASQLEALKSLKS